MLITFYSFKGGVGRSMAMVNVGEILADWGYNVILCDWDLEAPGLERYLTADRLKDAEPDEEQYVEAEVEKYKAQPGLIDLLHEYKAAMTETPAEGARRLAESERSDPAAHARSFKKVGKLYLRRPSSYAFAVSEERPRQGSLRLLTAGRREGNSYKAYAEAVRSFDWEEFYKKWAGASYMEFFRDDLTDTNGNGADIVLIDSRTGVTEHGGVATHHLADLVILLSAANAMNLEGTEWMARELLNPRLKELRGNRDLKVFPVPSRIEQTSQKNELVDFRRRFVELLGKCALEFTSTEIERFFLATEIPYMPYYSFYERVVAREGKSREQRLYAAYEFIAQCIARYGTQSKLLMKQPGQVRAVNILELGEHRTEAKPLAGTVYLSFSPADAELAGVLAQGLSGEGLRVWADLPMVNQTSSRQPEQQIEQAATEASACLILVGRDSFDNRAQADFDLALRQQVLRKDYRLLLLLRETPEQRMLPDELMQFRPIILPPEDSAFSDTNLFRRLAAEINASATMTTTVFNETISPYRGLTYFDEQTARFFFARDEEVRALVASLGETPSGHVRWLQLEGMNGSGKTSLARAGLIPAIQRGWLRGTRKKWVVVKTVMGADFIESLAIALSPLAQGLTTSVLQFMLNRPDGLQQIVRRIISPDSAVLLLIDGMEKLFDDMSEAARAAVRDFCEVQLASALSDKSIPFYLLTTIRSHVLEAYQELPKMGLLFEREARRFVVEPVPQAGLEEAIQGPARLAGLNFEKGLVERICQEVLSFKSPLAVLGPLLQSLWEKRTGNTLTHNSYQETGGAGLLLQNGLKSLIEGLGQEERERAKRIMLSMVRVGDASDGSVDGDTSAATSQAEALEAAGNDAVARKVLSQLMSPPWPIVIDSAGMLTLAQESLIRQWPFRHWIENEREVLRLRDDLKAAARLREGIVNKSGGQLLARINEDAERIYNTLSKDEQTRLTRILSRLVTFGPVPGDAGTLRAIPLSSIEEAERPLVEKLSEAGLLKINGEGDAGGPVVRVTNEYLLVGWERFKAWVKQNQRFLIWRQALENRMTDWEDHRRDPELLLRGSSLEQAKTYRDSKASELSKAEQTYIATSSTAQGKRQERQRISLIYLFLLLVVLLVGVYYVMNEKARQQESQLAVLKASLSERESQTAELKRNIEDSKSDAEVSRARLYLTVMAGGDRGDENRSKAAAALQKVVDMNSDSQGNNTSRLAQNAQKALALLEANDPEGALKALEAAPALPPTSAGSAKK